MSAGAVQTLDVGLTRPDTFAYIGVFIGGIGLGLENCAVREEAPRGTQGPGDDKETQDCSGSPTAKMTLPTGYCQDTLRLFDGYKIPYVYVEGKGFTIWRLRGTTCSYSPNSCSAAQVSFHGNDMPIRCRDGRRLSQRRQEYDLSEVNGSRNGMLLAALFSCQSFFCHSSL